MGITKPRAPAPFSVVPSLAPDARTSAISTSSGGAGSPGAGLRLPPVSPLSPRSQNSDDRSPRERGLLGSPRRRRSLRTTATDLPEVLGAQVDGEMICLFVFLFFKDWLPLAVGLVRWKTGRPGGQCRSCRNSEKDEGVDGHGRYATLGISSQLLWPGF